MPSRSPRKRLMLASTTPEKRGREPPPLRIGTGLDTGTPTTVDLPCARSRQRLMLSPGWSSLIMMWSVYRHDDSSRPAKPDENAMPGLPDENAMPGLAPAVPPGLDPVELVVDGERFVVTRRADSPDTYHFDWISHPASYGFTIRSLCRW